MFYNFFSTVYYSRVLINLATNAYCTIIYLYHYVIHIIHNNVRRWRQILFILNNFSLPIITRNSNIILLLYNGNVATHFIRIFFFVVATKQCHIIFIIIVIISDFATRRLNILIINNSFIPFGMPSSYNIARPPPVINIDKNPCYLLILSRLSHCCIL